MRLRILYEWWRDKEGKANFYPVWSARDENENDVWVLENSRKSYRQKGICTAVVTREVDTMRRSTGKKIDDKEKEAA